MPQTSVSIDPPALAVGMRIAYASDEADSGFNEEASALVGFGLMVKRGTALKGFKLLAAITDDMWGIIAYKANYNVPLENVIGTDGIYRLTRYTQAIVLQRGTIVVPVETLVNPEAKVYVRAVAVGSEAAGAFRSTTDSTDLIDCSAFAQWVSITTGAGFAKLRINMTGRKS